MAKHLFIHLKNMDIRMTLTAVISSIETLSIWRECIIIHFVIYVKQLDLTNVLTDTIFI